MFKCAIFAAIQRSRVKILANFSDHSVHVLDNVLALKVQCSVKLFNSTFNCENESGEADLLPLQCNESNYIFRREITSLTFSIFDEYSALLIVAYFANRK